MPRLHFILMFPLQQAIDANSFLESDPVTIKKGDVVEGFKGSDLIVEGEMYVGGQEHFYLETHACIAVPSGEDNEMTLISSTQDVQAIQVNFTILHGYVGEGSVS